MTITREAKSPSSWFSGICNDCGYNVVVTQSELEDYFWYCSNKYCKNHEGEELCDQDDCEFVN